MLGDDVRCLRRCFFGVDREVGVPLLEGSGSGLEREEVEETRAEEGGG